MRGPRARNLGVRNRAEVPQDAGMARHLTFANLASALALMVALSTGGAYAAAHLPRNSVASKQIKNGTVTGKDVKDGSLRAADFGAGELPAGPAGAPGSPGAPATKLFAAVLDNDPAQAATLVNNHEVVSVSDPAGANTAISPYVLTFDRDVSACAIFVTASLAEPLTGVASASSPLVVPSGTTAQVTMVDPSGAPIDTSFVIAAIC